MLKDFYFSESMYQWHKRCDPDKKPCNVLVDGRWFIYTECIDHGKEPLSKKNAPDLIHVATLEEVPGLIRVGNIGGTKMLERSRQRECDGVCQLCWLSCHIKEIVYEIEKIENSK